MTRRASNNEPRGSSSKNKMYASKHTPMTEVPARFAPQAPQTYVRARNHPFRRMARQGGAQRTTGYQALHAPLSSIIVNTPVASGPEIKNEILAPSAPIARSFIVTFELKNERGNIHRGYYCGNADTTANENGERFSGLRRKATELAYTDAEAVREYIRASGHVNGEVIGVHINGVQLSEEVPA